MSDELGGPTPLDFLVGTWRGGGHGEYPTVEPFAYEEELRFSRTLGFLTYSQQAWSARDGVVLHTESGFWRPAGPGRLEACLAHPLGLVEVAEGRVVGRTVALESSLVGRTASGSPVRALTRRYELAGEALRYELSMETDAVGLSLHLTAELRRV